MRLILLPCPTLKSSKASALDRAEPGLPAPPGPGGAGNAFGVEASLQVPLNLALDVSQLGFRQQVVRGARSLCLAERERLGGLTQGVFEGVSQLSLSEGNKVSAPVCQGQDGLLQEGQRLIDIHRFLQHLTL
ncbi:hypothetical protein EYF80_029251 [Liparis tanakae]|uniref:Uncharacterized protein n=1 Tax=Liparis tanakae TaxID=230148 RepID=A0A4Z2H3V6_9TELE|nr:hypothetical protein EYF80_029251 [Liparis tanakae]